MPPHRPMTLALAAAFLLAAAVGSAPAAPARSGIPGTAPALIFAYEALPYAGITDPDAGTFETGLEVRMHTHEVRYLQPLSLHPRHTAVVVGASYRRTFLDYDGWSFAQAPSRAEELSEVELILRWAHRSSRSRSWTASLQPGLFGAMDGKTADAFRVHGGITWSRHAPRRTVKYGVAFTPLFGRPFVLPVLGLTWTNGRGTSVDALLPHHAEVWYSPAGTLSWGLVARLAGNQYAVGFPGRVDNLKLATATAAAALRLPIVEGLRLTIEGGMAGVLRRFEADEDNVEVRDLHLKDGVYARASLGFGG